MKTIEKKLLSLVCAIAMVAGSLSGVTAQDRKEDGKAGVRAIDVKVVAINAAQQGGDSVFQFFSQEVSFDRNLVKGAPFSADIVSETIQVLPDGNRIFQRSEGRIYRDIQGRTRSERTYQLGGSNEQKQVINIRDSVAGASYSLDPETRIARKNTYYLAAPGLTPTDWIFTPPFNPNAPSDAPRRSTINQLTPAADASNTPDQSKKLRVSGGVLQGTAIRKVQPAYPAIARTVRASGPVQVQITISETGEVIDAVAINGHPALRNAAQDAARQWMFNPTEISGTPVKAQGLLTFNFKLPDKEPVEGQITNKITKYPARTENLGKRKIEGVECEGTRAVTTMPPGAIGNERPIETASETWYSPELQMTILSKRSDPRFGESIYQVTNIIRSEPEAALFQIPPDYTVIDSRARKVEVDVKEFEEMRRKIKEQKKAEGARKPDNQ
ncbi:MAG TPA: TonB family protein [Blastocatellia bacterium]|nr:TonB family protein [Blastocatellia bacterium]